MSSERYTMSESRKSRLTIKEGELFLVSDRSERSAVAKGSPLGLWARDTRFLSRFEMTITAAVRGPRLGGANATTPPHRVHESRVAPARPAAHPAGVPPPAAHPPHRRPGVRPVAREELRHAARRAPLRVHVRRRLRRHLRGARRTAARPAAAAGAGEPRRTARLTNYGADGVLRRTSWTSTGRRTRWTAAGSRFVLRLAPRERSILRFTIALGGARLGAGRRRRLRPQAGRRAPRPRTLVFGVHRGLHRQRAGGRAAAPRPARSGHAADRQRRGRLAMAGLPWFVAPFGRDLRSSRAADPGARSAPGAQRRQRARPPAGRQVDEARLEQPGRSCTSCAAGRWRTRRYPTRRRTCRWTRRRSSCILQCADVAWTGDLELFELRRDEVLAALSWIDTYGDVDGDGFVEYATSTPAGLIQQGWRDAAAASCTPTGRPPRDRLRWPRCRPTSIRPSASWRRSSASSATSSCRSACSPRRRRSSRTSTNPSGCRTRGIWPWPSTAASGRSRRSSRPPATASTAASSTRRTCR